MSIIDQLEQTVTPAILGNNGSVSHVSLLEQFYAILASRLALPPIYSQVLRIDATVISEHVVQPPLFEQLWQTASLRRLMIQELASTHHIDEFTTMQLLINATPLAYQELKTLANGQFLPAFLQAEQASLRPYLPIWSAPIIGAPQHSDDELFQSQRVLAGNEIPVVAINNDEPAVIDSITAPSFTTASPIPTLDERLSTDAIHVSPAAHHLAENSSLRREKTRTRNQRNDMLLWTFVLLGAVTAIGLVWALFIKPNDTPPVEAVVTTPVVVPPVTEPPAQVATPIELIVGVDNNGSLYTCSGLVGDTALQSLLQQALNTSFGEQAGMCQLIVKEGVASSIANMPVEVLPNVLTLLRAAPFARLQLQNDRMTVEAPDSMQLQRLMTDMRTLLPSMMIESTTPLPLPSSSTAMNNGAVEQQGMASNNFNNQFENAPANNNANNSPNTVEYQAPDDETNDSVMPAPVRNNNMNSANNFNNAPSGSNGAISLSEADDMANNIIVVEPAQVRR